ncbi:DegT/DnrJ/EryC1/StrS family aminotransferase [Parapedobacter indicus]|uniref:dTDP-4-amino-4,6-dideoxygalactose transaminase n=1 Tax=Parapedobacter indicus TaxID=1477437 RepID=A0A1I3TBG5_9SPHI|nr:DegT/DnrJ/EryC1/StrS family aminotransferase [Parapedobacter indicus]PPK99546.1 dTDP-4-amino-4,6-dideoxygalactose transaminase [Parapedobacter indicus]SFJ68518.1 dTDP-4-amino-4,6-dideoxygalactose transaminase [Parapedobacter indicus]
MDFIPLANPDIRESDINLVNDVLRSGMLVQGKYVEKLEQRFAEIVEVSNGIAVSNGTATMHLALRVLGIGPGDEVIVPAFSYVATANVVELVGATPVFVDIDINTFNIDTEKIEAKITKSTKAIIPVHEFGLSCDIEAVVEIARQYNLFVIEDAACAFGATQNGKSVGSFGDFGSFSLHPRKSITSGEGGIITTDNRGYAKNIGQLRNHGIEYVNGQMEFVAPGFNYRMTDFQAALAYGQSLRIEEIIQLKNTLAEVYLNEISNSDIKLPNIPHDRNHTWQTFHIVLGDKYEQQAVIRKLKDNNIGVNYGAQCIPATHYYQQKYGLNYTSLFPSAYRAYKSGIALPCYEKLNIEQVKYIANVINLL